MSEITAKEQMRLLAHKAQEVTKDATKSYATRRLELDKIEAQIKSYADEISMYDNARRLAGGASAPDPANAATLWTSAKAFGGPQMTPSEPQMKALHHAAQTKQNLRLEVETKSALDLESSLVPTLAPSIVAFMREPTRIASLIPNSPMTGPSMEYIRHIGNSGAAATVAAGTQKPMITLTTDTLTATARKIAGLIAVNDESLMDFHSTTAYVTNELQRSITSAENLQLLSGNGTAPNLQGILGTTGVLTRTQASSPETPIDTLELALNDLRVGASFTEATGFVMNPSDWSAIRLLKNSYGEYLLGHPAAGDAAMLWGKPVVVTTDCPAKTVLTGNFVDGAAILIREGIRLEAQSTGADFQTNVTTFRAEERLALAVYRPSAFVKVTLS